VALISIGEFAQRAQLSPKALRLYGELGLVHPARVDANTGYRYYDLGQLERARLVASLRQIGMSLADIAAVIDLPDDALAARITAFWKASEDDHSARRRLAELIVARLNGTRFEMYEVSVRDVPSRQLLGMQRNIASSDEVFAMGREFISLFKATTLPRPEGVPSTLVLIYHGAVSNDSDGPVEVCRPVPDEHVGALVASFPTLTLRTEPAHREAVVQLGFAEPTAAQWGLVSESIRDWTDRHGEQPSDLGTRVVMTAVEAREPGLGPDREFAVPLR
jgi:DNA-binding transcriptional MerR regulator